MAFRAKYSAEQRAAAVRAVLEYQLSYREASRRAHRGELPGAPDDLPAFDMGPEYLGDLVRAEKQRRGVQERAASSPEEIMRETLGVLAERLDREVRKLQKRRRVTGDEITGLAKAGREVASLARAVHGLPQPRVGGPKPRENGASASGDDFIGALAAGEPRD